MYSKQKSNKIHKKCDLLNIHIRNNPQAYSRSFIPGYRYRIKDKWAPGKWTVEVINRDSYDSTEYKLKDGQLPFVNSDTLLILPVNRKKNIILVFEKVGKSTSSYKYVGLKFIGNKIHKLQVDVTYNKC